MYQMYFILKNTIRLTFIITKMTYITTYLIKVIHYHSKITPMDENDFSLQLKTSLRTQNLFKYLIYFTLKWCYNQHITILNFGFI